MKCLIFFVLLMAFCDAYFRHGIEREIRVDGERRIFLRGFGKMVIINVPKDDPKSIEIVVKGSAGFIKIIKINENKEIVKQISVGSGVGVDKFINEDHSTDSASPLNSQMKVLTDIFKNYQGIAGEATFYQVLKEVKQAVERGDLNKIVYDVISELEVQPAHVISTTHRWQSTDKTDAEEVSTETYNNESGEAEKYRFSKDVKHSMGTHQERSDQNSKLDQMLQATRQIQWIQSLLEKRRQQLASSHKGDLIKDTDTFLKASLDYHNQKDLKQLVLQTKIQELQGEIVQEQLRSQQLSIQQQFLSGQKQQLKSYLEVTPQNLLHDTQKQLLNQAYQQITRQEEKLADEQLDIQKTIQKLQDKLSKQYEELKHQTKNEDMK